VFKSPPSHPLLKTGKKKGKKKKKGKGVGEKKNNREEIGRERAFVEVDTIAIRLSCKKERKRGGGGRGGRRKESRMHFDANHFPLYNSTLYRKRRRKKDEEKRTSSNSSTALSKKEKRKRGEREVKEKTILHQA